MVEAILVCQSGEMDGSGGAGRHLFMGFRLQNKLEMILYFKFHA